MKFSVLAAAALAQLGSAHYFFDQLVIEGKETKPYEFVRENTRPAKYNPTKWKNTRDDMTPDMTDFRCNKGAFASASRTGTAEVKAGSKLAMKLGVGATMKHPGPAFVWMSKAPTTAQAYEGEGNWFKVFQSGMCDKSKDILGTAWCTWDKDRIEFTVPQDLLAGEYLVRPEHIGIHGAHDGQAEFYYGCAQIKVTGSGSAVPSDTVKFPGAWKKDDPAVNFSIWGGMKDYPMPAPAVYTAGGASGGSPNATQPATEPTPVQSAAPVASKPATEEPAPVESAATVESGAPEDYPAPGDYPAESAAPVKSAAPIASAAASAAPVVHNDVNCGAKNIAARSNSRIYRALMRK